MDAHELEKSQADIQQLFEGLKAVRRSILDVPEQLKALILQVLSLPNDARTPEQQAAIDEVIAAIETWLGHLVMEAGGEFTPATKSRRELFVQAEAELAFYEHNVFSKLKKAYGME